MNLKGIKNVFYIFLMSLLMVSCVVRTYTVSEKSAFTPTEYDISLDSSELNAYNKQEQEKLLLIAGRIIDSSKHKIVQEDGFSLNRDYLKINDSVVVEHLCYLPKDYERTIVFFIGNQSRQTTYVNFLQQLSVESKSKIYTWNYRGYGNSSGKSSFKTQFEDNKYIFEQLQCRENNKELIIIGYSLGTVFCAKLAENVNADKMILLAPVSDITEMLIHYKRQFLGGVKIVLRPFIDLKAKEEFVRGISNTEVIKKYEGDLLIVHSKDDTDLPYSMGKKLYENSISGNKKFITLKRGGHGAPFEEENWKKVITWMTKGNN